MAVVYLCVVIILAACGILSIVCYNHMTEGYRKLSLYNMVASVVIIGLYSAYMFDERIKDAEIKKESQRQQKILEEQRQSEVKSWTNKWEASIAKVRADAKKSVTEARQQAEQHIQELKSALKLADENHAMHRATSDKEIERLRKLVREYQKQVEDYEKVLTENNDKAISPKPTVAKCEKLPKRKPKIPLSRESITLVTNRIGTFARKTGNEMGLSVGSGCVYDIKRTMFRIIAQREAQMKAVKILGRSAEQHSRYNWPVFLSDKLKKQLEGASRSLRGSHTKANGDRLVKILAEKCRKHALMCLREIDWKIK